MTILVADIDRQASTVLHTQRTMITLWGLQN